MSNNTKSVVEIRLMFFINFLSFFEKSIDKYIYCMLILYHKIKVRVKK
jgi:hypothetical protein